MEKDQNIPILTDLVVAGNPKLKLSDKDKRSYLHQSENLHLRINQIETAIGQDEPTPVGRAFAIRAEETGKQGKPPAN